MRTETINIYKFDELTEETQQKVIENYRLNTIFYHEDIIEDICEICEKFGLNVKQTYGKNIAGNTIYAPSIYFSGFSSQGDGANFEGVYSYTQKGCLKKIKSEYPNDTELHKIVEALQNIQKRYFYSLKSYINPIGRYFNISVDTEHIEGFEISKNVCGDMEEIMNDITHWIYKRLETEYEYIMSDEYIIEEINTNDYEFHEDGTMV